MTTAYVKGDGSLSIRSYTLTQYRPMHMIITRSWCRLNGAMDIMLDAQIYNVSVGHCVIIPSAAVHSYSAPEKSRFLVADMDSLPVNAANVEQPSATISADFLAFLLLCRYAAYLFNG